MRHYALAIGLATLASSTFAQSSVEVYGRLDISLNRWNYESTSTKPSAHLDVMSSDVSMIGFRGREDLGGGLRAYFKLEHGLQLDTGALTTASTFWNRESYVGIASSTYGGVQMGSMYSPNIYATVRVDPFARFTSASMIYLLQGFGGTRGSPSIFNNTTAYISPNISGVSGKVLLSLGEGATTGRSYSGSLEYDKGPVYASLVYDQLKLLSTAVGLTGAPVKSAVWNLGGTYDFSMVKLHGWFQDDHVDRLAINHSYMAGISAPIGVGVVKASYTRRNSPTAGASLIGLGYDYYFSKRTLAYTDLALMNNRGVASFTSGPSVPEQRSANLPAPGRDAKGLQVGIRHYF